MLLQIGELKKGLNPGSLTDLVFKAPYMTTAIKTGLVTGIIAMAVSLYLSILFSFIIIAYATRQPSTFNIIIIN